MSVVRLLGQNIGYSASVAMHSAAFAELGLPHTYELADVAADQLSDAVAALRDGNCLGANVTVPHKAAVLELVDKVEPLAERAGAVNTIVSREGRLHGSNTDIPAIADDIQRIRPAPRSAVVLGAGGAARAARLALEAIGTGQTVLVARSGRAGAADWAELPTLVAQADLLVNATPVGTTSDDSPVAKQHLHQGLAVLDLVYRPSPTRLVREARECGLRARAGAGVLFGQGWRSLEAWLGQAITESAKHAMADSLLNEIGPGADV